MQDGDTHVAILVYVGVKDRRDELHCRRLIGEVFGEDEFGLEEATLVQGVRGAYEQHFPVVQLVLVQAYRDVGRGGF